MKTQTQAKLAYADAAAGRDEWTAHVQTAQRQLQQAQAQLEAASRELLIAERRATEALQHLRSFEETK